MTVGGITACCNGKAYACLYPPNLAVSMGYPLAPGDESIIKACIKANEEWHVKRFNSGRVGKCINASGDSSNCGYVFLPDDRNLEQCKSAEAQLKCLLGKAPQPCRNKSAICYSVCNTCLDIIDSCYDPPTPVDRMIIDYCNRNLRKCKEFFKV